MRPEELLEMTPALLAKSILHRRERLAETIPEQLDARQDELRAAEPLARSAKEQRDGLNAKVANLKKERNDARKTAKNLFQEAGELRDNISSSGGVQKANPEWAKNKLDDKLKALEHELETNSGNHKTEQKYIAEMKALIRKHEEWVEKRTDNQEENNLMKSKYSDARKHLDIAEKAHQALLDHASENEYFHNTYLEQESHRRRADARTKRLAQALDSSQRGIEHWQKHIDNGFDALLENSKRVESGEPSSHARRRNRNAPEQNSKQSPPQVKARGEEE
tara:strand:- start:5876 stop:6712 length:837 start_codon:yes stop_codon:yes gene_type:complete